MRLLSGCLAALICTVALAAQGPPQTPAGKAHLSGRVIDAETRAPVPGAVVKMGPRTRLVDRYGKIGVELSVFSSSHRFTMTDAEGRFTFADAEPDMLVLVAEAPGYLLSAYGQLGPDTPPRQFFINAGQRLELDIAAWRPGIITGTVRDEAGEPVIDVPVQAMRRRFEAGARRFGIQAEARTDDRGIYRIVDLLPGEYLVAVRSTAITSPPASTEALRRDATIGAGPPRAGVAIGGGHAFAASGPWPPVTTDVASIVYPTSFHPSVTNPDDATVVRLGAAEVRSGVDLHLMPVRAFRVSGHVVSAAGPVGGTSLTLVVPGSGSLSGGSEVAAAETRAQEDGSFLFAGVPVGRYLLRALHVPVANPDTPGPTASGFSPEDRPTLSAEMTLTVDGPVDLTVSLSPGRRISGRIVFESATQPDEGRIRSAFIRLVPSDGRDLRLAVRTMFGPKFTFTTPSYPPGRYYMAASPIGAWYLKSIVVNGRNALRRPIELGNDDLAGAVVTYSDQTYTIFGNVTGSPVNPEQDPGAIVVIFPAEHETWIGEGMNPLLHHAAVTYPGGTFRMPRIIPGDYLVGAVDADAGHDVQDPAFLMKLAPLATRVSIREPETSGIVVRRVVIR
jgi:hypothetical protein